uniref:Fungal lipase-type domain-containing protein n=2 Tax=Leptocylindrus danicus TaxID=163516 RepID=A0A7S2KYC6_9STRA
MSEMVLNVTGVLFASNADSGGAGLQAAADRIRVAATKIAKDQGLDMDVAAGQAAAITKYTVDLLQFANNVLNEGYLSTTTISTKVNDNMLVMDDSFASSVDYKTNTAQSQAALFDGFDASILERSNPLLVKAGEMAAISGAVYLPNILPETLHKYGHAVVANGTTADIAWLVTDSIMYDDYVEGNGSPKLVRTVTLRGYDASDANVDRERLVTEVCNATRYSLENNGVDVHIGLMGIAQDLYEELAPFIDQTSSSHKIILNGHSIGGSLSNLLLLLLCMDRGAKYVKDRVANVFTFGSPPVAVLNEPDHVIFERARGIEGYCGILDAFGLPGSLVQGFLQPWDPVTRLFSEIDALYPLVDDMGEDGLTPWVNGPPRTLRPIVRQLFESLEVWPKMRTNYELTGGCKYVFIGTPHLLLPEPSRYLTDRLVSVNLAVPPIDTVLKAEATQLVPMLQKAFPLDEFSISLVSVALRSFIHHFHPAYGLAMEDHVMGNPSKSENALKEAEKDARESDFVKDIFGIRT